MKFYDSVFAIDKKQYEKLRNRKALFQEYTGTKKQLFTTLISSNGIKYNDYANEIVDSEVTLKDLFVG